ncbi:MAG: MCE family protein [Victivallales bacterium]|nr:MCE family protein [Victivallales bacterium]
MKQKKNAFYLGLFVLGALLVLVILLLSIGGQKIFTKQVNFILYFDKSVKGLNIGAPVMFRGVRVGQVEAIQFAKQLKKRRGVSWPIEVIIALDPASLDVGKDATYSSSSFVDSTARNALLLFQGQKLVKEWMETMVAENSLCAWLQTLSLLTGQLYIELDFDLEYPPTKHEIKMLKEGVIPSRMSTIERISQTLKSKDRMEAFNIAITQLSDFVSSGRARETLDNLFVVSENAKNITGEGSRLISSFTQNSTKTGFSVLTVFSQASQTLMNANRFLVTLNESAPEILADAKEAVATAKGTLVNANETITNVNSRITELSAKIDVVIDSVNQFCEKLNTDADLEKGPGAKVLQDIHELTNQMQKTFAELETTIVEVQNSLKPNSQERIAIQNFMEQINRTAASIRAMADTIQQNPESLLWGKEK